MSKCDPLESLGRNFFGGGIELAIHFSSFKEWVPLTYVYISGDDTAKQFCLKIALAHEVFDTIYIIICIT